MLSPTRWYPAWLCSLKATVAFKRLWFVSFMRWPLNLKAQLWNYDSSLQVILWKSTDPAEQSTFSREKEWSRLSSNATHVMRVGLCLSLLRITASNTIRISRHRPTGLWTLSSKYRVKSEEIRWPILQTEYKFRVKYLLLQIIVARIIKWSHIFRLHSDIFLWA